MKLYRFDRWTYQLDVEWASPEDSATTLLVEGLDAAEEAFRNDVPKYGPEWRIRTLVTPTKFDTVSGQSSPIPRPSGAGIGYARIVVTG